MEDREVIAQGRALKAIRQTPGFEALEALIERKSRDLFQKWAAGAKDANGRELSRDWCDGYLCAVGEVVRDVDEMIRQAGERDPLNPEKVAVTAGSSLLGRGELAL